MRIYDITVPISAGGTPTYPGDPGIEIKQWAALAAGDAANVTLLNFGAHTATHIDAPAHFIEGAMKIDALPLDAMMGRARVLEIKQDVRVIDRDELARHDLCGVTRLLFKTGNSRLWAEARSNFQEDFTYIEPEAARVLAQSGVRLVGMDYLSVEKFKSERHETHIELLSRNVVIVEGLDLSKVPAGDYELICLPLKIASGTGDGAPARAVLRTLD
ncbi:MAG TPA: cyclase family protein [Pyrinomonadaceae bacterium]|jgi:arylformamidase|nr:cyclase family protein [Pyrinomonadaceae bacterium]